MTETSAVILAGGLARRMGGGDKARLIVGGRTVLARIIDTIRPQVAHLAINANGASVRFADTRLPVLPDPLPDYPGPLAGILAALEWATTRYVVSVPGDCPFLPPDLVARLHHARDTADARYACAGSGGWTHPVIALWPTSCAPALRAALQAGERKVDRFARPAETATAEWPISPYDPFFNLNSPEDLAEANRLATPPSSTASPAAARPARRPD